MCVLLWKKFLLLGISKELLGISKELLGISKELLGISKELLGISKEFRMNSEWIPNEFREVCTYC